MLLPSPVILDLCSGTGAWSLPFLERGFHVYRVDIRNNTEHDVRTWQPYAFLPNVQRVYGVLASPPCTEFALSGARWWASKDAEFPMLLDEAKNIVRGCLRIINAVKPRWWALENPKGRIAICVPELATVPRWYFQPYEYEDFHRKITYIYGNVKKPKRNPNLDVVLAKAVAVTSEPEHTIQFIGPSADRDLLRGAIPPGFAQAFAQQVTQQFPLRATTPLSHHTTPHHILRPHHT